MAEKESKEILLNIYAHEYEKIRDEINTRIGIQNQMAQRSLSVTAMMVSVLAVLFTFFMKDFNGPSQHHSVNLFVSLSIFVLLAHGILTQLTLAAWIYQLSIMFRIDRYWNWVVETKIDPMIGEKKNAYLYGRDPNPPWDIPVDRKIVRYFQPLFVYSTCLFGLLIIPISLWWRPSEYYFNFTRIVGFTGGFVLLLTLYLLTIVHRKVPHDTEAFKKTLWQKKRNSEKNNPQKDI